MTANEFGMPFEVIVVPSNGSKAISTASPLPVPTFSPIYNIGASSLSPSPITILPSNSISLRAVRIASTAS